MLIDEIKAFLNEADMAESTFGRLFMNNPSYVRELRNGRSSQESTAVTLRSRMAVYLLSLEGKRKRADEAPRRHVS